MKAPAQVSDISKDWIQYMLTDFENRENPGTQVTVDSFETNKGSKLGDGIVGTIIKLKVQANIVNCSDNKLNKEYDLVIKLKGGDPRMGFVLEKAEFYSKELLMYSKILIEFDNFQKNKGENKYPIHIPKFIYGKCENNEFVLVMENIMENGFFIHDNKKTLDIKHLKLAVKQLVGLHAISFCYNQSYSFLERHPEFQETEYCTAFMKLFNPAIFDIQCEILKKEKNPAIVNKIKTNKSNLIKQCQEMHNIHKYKLLCLVHGDVHANNMMFKYAEDDENHENPINIRILDWQVPHWNTPVMDLQYLIYSSTSREFRKEHLEDILMFYHSAFVEATSTMGVEGLNWTYEDFKTDFSRMALYGLNRAINLAFGHHCPGAAQLHEDEKQKAINRSSFVKALQAPFFNLIEKYFFSSVVDSMMNFAYKTGILPFIKEITNRENTNLATRILDLIYEAEENGLFG